MKNFFLNISQYIVFIHSVNLHSMCLCVQSTTEIYYVYIVEYDKNERVGNITI